MGEGEGIRGVKKVREGSERTRYARGLKNITSDTNLVGPATIGDLPLTSKWRSLLHHRRRERSSSLEQ